ncbi:hypothetical protein N4T57_04545 [Campylobacter hepaticus]|nr:hypothetical protein [Campylobacter hepaticus]MCZ0772415.1 hypothetical protein [Campylobacter hepaticus]MCZ0773883.1 hypothetical protein [Campylobacter hepaticus]MCZ0775134.1 hypothetical protein [Campylobacter hepaticus]MDX2323362.1 hypothetical protein [Campylobacter hepaticus]MDX2331209.1 hypothetical protein [Campylobacter hepaticus]
MKILDFIILLAFALLIFFLVLGFNHQMIEKNKKRERNLQIKKEDKK